MSTPPLAPLAYAPSLVACCLFLSLAPNPSRAAEPAATADDLPRLRPTAPADTAATFKVRPGFKFELAAAEPLVADPVAMAFDEFGRLYVVEMRDYSERRDERLGRIRLLEDSDQNGSFDKSTVFTEDLPWPTAVVCYDGGVFVGANPDIWYFKDADGDGKAEIARKVFTGFGNEAARLNVQQLLNSFHWGLDNRIHGAIGGNPGTATTLGREGVPAVPLRGRDFSFDPKALDLRPESGGAQHGMSFDDGGRKFLCSNSDHIQLVISDDRLIGQNRWLIPPPPRISIAEDGPAAEVFRISPDEPWRVLRTRWRVAGLVPGPIEGGGRPSGYFTGATGTTIYRGDAWPAEYLGDAFIADCGSNLIHRKKLHPDGVALIARRAADETKSEFIASTDIWFRPVQFVNGPDGNLYVLDMYREVIEHPWSLPESIKRHLDLNSGNDRGRIYRIAAANYRYAARALPGPAQGKQLIEMLGHPNGWHRDTAARLIYERASTIDPRAVERFYLGCDRPLGRLHALAALQALDALKPAHLSRALADPDSRVRVQALKLAFDRLPEHESSLLEGLKPLARDPEPWVRFHLASVLGRIQSPVKQDLLETIISQSPGDRWISLAVLSAVASDAATLASRVLRMPAFTAERRHAEFLAQLAQVIGARAIQAEVATLLDALDSGRDLRLAGVVLPGLSAGLRRSGSSELAASLESRLSALSSSAARLAADPSAAIAARTDAVRVLGAIPGATSSMALLQLFNATSSGAIQSAAMDSLFNRPDSAWLPALFDAWTRLTPALRKTAIERSAAESTRTRRLLEALAANKIAAADLPPPQQAALRNHADERIRTQAGTLLGQAQSSSKQALLDAFMPALRQSGDAARGEAIFVERCATCHRFGPADNSRGTAVGPDLATIKDGGKEKILLGILDPNREVASAFVQYQVETTDGEEFTGIVAAETDSSLSLRAAAGVETHLPRTRIKSARSLGVSLMPEGLEAGLNTGQMADLLEFIVRTH